MCTQYKSVINKTKDRPQFQKYSVKCCPRTDNSFEFFSKFYLKFMMAVLVTEYADKKDQMIRKKVLKDNYECLVRTKEINYSAIGSQSLKDR